jgi:hypothetical protein
MTKGHATKSAQGSQKAKSQSKNSNRQTGAGHNMHYSKGIDRQSMTNTKQRENIMNWRCFSNSIKSKSPITRSIKKSGNFKPISSSNYTITKKSMTGSSVLLETKDAHKRHWQELYETSMAPIAIIDGENNRQRLINTNSINAKNLCVPLRKKKPKQASLNNMNVIISKEDLVSNKSQRRGPGDGKANESEVFVDLNT